MSAANNCTMRRTATLFVALTLACSSGESASVPTVTTDDTTTTTLLTTTTTTLPRAVPTVTPPPPQCSPRGGADTETAGPQRHELLGGVSYLVEENVLESDLTKIRQGIELGSRFVAAQLGGVAGYVCVDIRLSEDRNGSGGTYFGDRMVMFTGVSGWRGPRSLPWHLAKVTAHEYAHVWQRDYLNRRAFVGPRWLHEGGAELIGVRSLIDAGVVREAEAQSFLRPNVTSRDLRDFEPAAMGGFDYSLGYFAVEFLIRGSGLASLRNYMVETSQGAGWEAAFSGVFGVDVATFYERFDRHRTAGFPS